MAMPKLVSRLMKGALVFLFLLFGFVLVGSISISASKYREYAYFLKKEQEYRRSLEDISKRLEEHSAYLHLLREDAAVVERIARLKLDYSRPDELIFRFDAF